MENVSSPISTQELERRWAAIRVAMASQGIDVLVFQNNNDYMGGYVKYFTDMPAGNGYPVTVIFPRDDRMTVISQGPFGHSRIVAEDDVLRRGVKRVLGTPSYSSACYTAVYDAELLDKVLSEVPHKTVGLVGPSTLPYSLMAYVEKNALKSSAIVDASDLVDQVKSKKSPEEMVLIRATAALQDEAMREVYNKARPGMREWEIAAIAEQACRRLGSEQGIFLCGSAPVGQAMVFDTRHMQNRIVGAGDYFALLVETNGPGGFYTELGRTFVFGKASDDMRVQHEFTLHARSFALGMLRPGASGRDIWESFNSFMKTNGRPVEERLFCHGQGYDLVERPLVRFDEPMPIDATMSIVCHPTFVTSTTFSWICDNYLFDPSGTPVRIHESPEVIFEI